jgi:hypothetical protein
VACRADVAIKFCGRSSIRARASHYDRLECQVAGALRAGSNPRSRSGVLSSVPGGGIRCAPRRWAGPRRAHRQGGRSSSHSSRRPRSSRLHHRSRLPISGRGIASAISPTEPTTNASGQPRQTSRIDADTALTMGYCRAASVIGSSAVVSRQGTSRALIASTSSGSHGSSRAGCGRMCTLRRTARAESDKAIGAEIAAGTFSAALGKTGAHAGLYVRATICGRSRVVTQVVVRDPRPVMSDETS